MFENILCGIMGLVTGIFITWVVMRNNNPIRLFVYNGAGLGPVITTPNMKLIGRAALKGFAVKVKLHDGTLNGLVPSAPNDSVKGHVFMIQRRHLPDCDYFAGHLYRRVTALLTDGTAVETYLWTSEEEGQCPVNESP